MSISANDRFFASQSPPPGQADPVSQPASDGTLVDGQDQESAVETALDVALLVMENGGSTFRADQTLQAMLNGLHLEGVSALWQLNAVTVFMQRDGQMASRLCPIRAAGVNLTRVSAAWALARQVGTGAIAPADIPNEIQRIKALATPYGPRVMVAIAALTAASFSQFIGGDGGSLGLAAAAGGLGQFVRLHLQARHLTSATVTLLCALLSALVGTLGLRAGWSQVVPATLMGSVGYMMPGLPLANGFADLISQRHLSVGLERIANAVFVFMLLTLGIAVANALVP